MDEAIADIFETCLQRIAAGATVEECLVAYPASRATLEPLLRSATRLQSLPRPAPLPAAAQATLATRILAQVASSGSTTTSGPRLGGMPVRAGRLGPSALLAGTLRALGYRGPLAQPWLRLGAAAIGLALALALVAAIYGAVRAIFPPPPDGPAAFAPATSFDLEGPIEATSEAGLIVAGIAVDLGPQTVIAGTPALGASARVHGQIRDDGTLLAESVAVEGAAAEASPTTAPVVAATTAPTAAPTPPPEPTAAPTPPPEPTAAPVAEPGGDPLPELRQLLEAGQADGRAGPQGKQYLDKLDQAEKALSNGNSKKAGDQLRDLYKKLDEQVREGKTDPAFAQQAQELIAAVGEAYQLSSVPDDTDNGRGNDEDKDEKDEKDD